MGGPVSWHLDDGASSEGCLRRVLSLSKALDNGGETLNLLIFEKQFIIVHLEHRCAPQ
jgi:hypothetical protein